MVPMVITQAVEYALNNMINGRRNNDSAHSGMAQYPSTITKAKYPGVLSELVVGPVTIV